MRFSLCIALLAALLTGLLGSAVLAQSTDEAGEKAETKRYSIFDFGSGDDGDWFFSFGSDDADEEADEAQAEEEPKSDSSTGNTPPEPRRWSNDTAGAKIEDKVETKRYSIFNWDEWWGDDDDAEQDSGVSQPDTALQDKKLEDSQGTADDSSPLNLLPGNDRLREALPPLAGDDPVPDLQLDPAKPDSILPTSPADPLATSDPQVSPADSRTGGRANPLAGLTDAARSDENADVSEESGPASPGGDTPNTKRLGDALNELMRQNPVVARVNGAEIRWADVMISARRLPDEYQSQVEAVFPALLDRLIDLELLSGAARDEGLADDEDIRRRIREFETRLLREVYLQRRIAQRLTPETLRSRYDDLAAEVAARHEVRARHIQVASREEAESLIKQLDEGADFAWLARQHSTSSSGERGGDLGYFDPARMVPEFSEAAYALEEGAYTRVPVKTEFGWHVIELVDRRSDDLPSFFEMRDQLREEMAKEIVADIVYRLRAEADLEVFPEDSQGTGAVSEDGADRVSGATN